MGIPLVAVCADDKHVSYRYLLFCSLSLFFEYAVCVAGFIAQDNAAWANDLADYERTLEALTQASLDESFTAELSAIEQCESCAEGPDATSRTLEADGTLFRGVSLSGFRVLSESERTATLYSLLQHSTRTQVKFFTSVLATMAQSDPLSAIMSPNPAAAAAMQNSLQQAQMAGLRSPGAGAGGASLNYPGSVQVPAINQFLAPDSANDNNNGGGLGGGAGSQQQNPSSASAQLAAQRVKNRNRISAPGTLLGAGGGLNNGNGDSAGDAARYIGGKLDDVIERGGSPFDEPGAAAAGIGLARASPRPDGRPVTSDFSGFANNISVPLGGSAFPRSPRPDETSFANSQTIGLGLPSPGLDQLISPLLAGANWASAVNTPQIPMFATHGRQPDATALNQALASTTMHLASVQNELANLQLGAGAGGGRPNPISLSDASQFRRTGATGPAIGPGGIRSGNIYNDDGELVGQGQPGGRAQASPMLNAGQWTRSPMVGGNDFGLGLGMGQIGHDHNGKSRSSCGDQASRLTVSRDFASGSPYTPRHGLDRASSRSDRNRRSPLLRQSPSPGVPPPPAAANAGGGAGAGAGVAGVEDVDERVLKDVSSWLRTLRLHKYTPNFQGSRWQDMVNMNEADLEKKGVAAQGARRKLLKVRRFPSS